MTYKIGCIYLCHQLYILHFLTTIKVIIQNENQYRHTIIQFLNFQLQSVKQ